MNPVRTRTLHRRLGISIAFFLFVQAVAGMFMSIGKLASVDASPLYNMLYSIHAGWESMGSVYRVVLGLATATQGVLGFMIFRSRGRPKKKEGTASSSDQPVPLKKEGPVRTPSFAAHIRPLFRPYDIDSMKAYSRIDFASYEDVKRHARVIYDRLSAKDMPCDGPWSEDSLKEFKEWMESGMEP